MIGWLSLGSIIDIEESFDLSGIQYDENSVYSGRALNPRVTAILQDYRNKQLSGYYMGKHSMSPSSLLYGGFSGVEFLM